MEIVIAMLCVSLLLSLLLIFFFSLSSHHTLYLTLSMTQPLSLSFMMSLSLSLPYSLFLSSSLFLTLCAMIPGLCSVGCLFTNNTSPLIKWRYTLLPGWVPEK